MVDKSPGFILKTPKVKEDLKQWRTISTKTEPNLRQMERETQGHTLDL